MSSDCNCGAEALNFPGGEHVRINANNPCLLWSALWGAQVGEAAEEFRPFFCCGCCGNGALAHADVSSYRNALFRAQTESALRMARRGFIVSQTCQLAIHGDAANAILTAVGGYDLHNLHLVGFLTDDSRSYEPIGQASWRDPLFPTSVGGNVARVVKR